jgi:virginiamycin B lyase
LVVGPDKAIWFIEATGAKIGRVTSDGVVSEYLVPSLKGDPEGYELQLEALTSRPDGALWFTDVAGNKIGRITTNGEIREFDLRFAKIADFNPLPTQPMGVAAGPDGAVWFAEAFGNSIGRITTEGKISEFPLLRPEDTPGASSPGPTARCGSERNVAT